MSRTGISGGSLSQSSVGLEQAALAGGRGEPGSGGETAGPGSSPWPK